MNTKKVWLQIIVNIISLAVSPFYLILAGSYVGYMVYLVTAEVKMGILLLVPMFIFLPVIVAGCLLVILRIILLITCFRAKKSISSEDGPSTRKFVAAFILTIIDAIVTFSVLTFDALAFLAAIGDMANKQLLGNLNEGLAGFIMFFILAFAAVPVIIRVGLGIASALFNVSDSKKCSTNKIDG
ncbi:MAG: hypothetical protein K5988_07885 [Lachnospiraceae bacterium]|nr:hypothetical protein [Lachnospiraceae bacterium]